MLKRLLKRLRKHAPIRELGSSLSDNQFYPQACLNAASDYRQFNTFRRNPDYCQILEQLGQDWGEAYWREIQKRPHLIKDIEKFRDNDRPGGPLIYPYPLIGLFSPTTLRYIKILGDLQHLYGSLTGLNIHEIGVGYGGQCRVIQAIEQPSAYTLIDLQPALALTQRYLDHFALAGPVCYKTMNELRCSDSDLVISNYAFSELRRDVQEIYLSRLINKAKRGYMLLNQINPESFDSYSYSELLAAIPGSRLVDEQPLTYPGNALLIWGSDREI